MNSSILILDFLDDETKIKVDDFRNRTSSIGNQARSAEENKIHLDKYCSDRDIKKWILVLENKEVVGMTAVFGRKIIFNKQEILLGGVGKVRVRDDRRKMGLASKMMNETMRQLSIINSDVAYLCTDINSFLVKFYEKYGFVKMKQPYTFLSKSRKRYIENKGMLAAIRSKKIYDSIMKSDELLDIGLGNW